MKKFAIFLLISAALVFAASGHSTTSYGGGQPAIVEPGNRAAAFDSNKRLKGSEVTVQNILKLLSGKNLGRIDEDGDLFVTDGNYKGYVYVYPDKKMVKISALWGGNLKVDESVAIVVANEFNAGKVLGKAYYYQAEDGEGRMRLVYDFVYDDGVSAVFLNETLNWFWALCSGFSSMINEKNLFE
ncbi:YbjN domain-containing protein [uncultured Fibrobacter sp.]|uniref:YbjN domain-containing protein n=1 Tax=uncultured Fibrobacter sp. TaxID=261512 RepID=UPI00156605D6|nr:YbjN domain-containing protein [uncultured Fibrobacter sp.]